MTSSIPNSFSSDDLERMLKNAITEEEVHNQAGDVSDEYEPEEKEMIKLASRLCDEACEQSKGPMIHKVMMLTMLTRLIEWHTTIGIDIAA